MAAKVEKKAPRCRGCQSKVVLQIVSEADQRSNQCYAEIDPGRSSLMERLDRRGPACKSTIPTQNQLMMNMMARYVCGVSIGCDVASCLQSFGISDLARYRRDDACQEVAR